jgi:cyclopropane fatty-acyl-phospholipid synthase-like methyltransferase
MPSQYKDILTAFAQYTEKPALFEPGEPHFWDDPHIAKSMLEAHLDPLREAASRQPETIDQEVNHLASCGIIEPGDKVLDLGCGPGLYASRLAAKGIKVTGIDFSENSLNYAIAQALQHHLDIEYHLLNFFDLDYSGEFDTVIQVEGEIGTFSDEKRDTLLAKLHRALKPKGMLVFDVTTPALKLPACPQYHWYTADNGFWRPGQHLTMELRFDYPDDNVFVNQYIVIDEEKISVYRIWNHNYTPDTIKPVLEKAGFRIVDKWNSLAGTPYKTGGEWLAVAAMKI